MTDKTPSKYTVEPHPDGPIEHEHRRRRMTSIIARITPAFDEPNNFFELVGIMLQPGVAVVPGVKENEDALQVQLTTAGHDEAAKERLERAVEGVSAYANQWHDPQAYINFRYSNPIAHPETAHEPLDSEDQATESGKQYIPYEDFEANPDDYYERLGQGEEVEVIMRLQEKWTDEDRQKLGLSPDPGPDPEQEEPLYAQTDTDDEGFGHGGSPG